MPRYRQGFWPSAPGSTFSSTSRRTDSRASRNRNFARSSVPNRLPRTGNSVPLARRNKQGRPARLVDPSLDGGDLQIGVDLLVDDDELLGSFEVADALRQESITHLSKPLSNTRPVLFRASGLVRPRRLARTTLIAAVRYCMEGRTIFHVRPGITFSSVRREAFTEGGEVT